MKITDNKKNILSEFTKKYPLSKTLRFELKPNPITKEFLRKEKFAELDTQRDQDYKELKKIIDCFHQEQIERVLSYKPILSTDTLEKLKENLEKFKSIQLINDRHKTKKNIEHLQKELRKEIVNQFKEERYFNYSFEDIFGKKLIIDILPKWLENKEDSNSKKNIVKKFNSFTTYLKGFHQNRKNMYSDKEQSTAISYRIINENFPKFIRNYNTYQKIKTKHPKLKNILQKELTNCLKNECDYFNLKNIEIFFKMDFFNKCLSQKGIDHYNTIIGGKTEGNKKIQGINEKINSYRQQHTMKPKTIPNMEILYKQILSDRESHSFIPKSFRNNQELINSINDFSKSIFKTTKNQNTSKTNNLLDKIQDLFIDMSNNKYELDKIYFNSDQLSNLSQSLFDDWRYIKNSLQYYSEEKEELFKTKKERQYFLEKDFFSFEELHHAVISYNKVCDHSKKKNILSYFQNIDEYFRNNLSKRINTSLGKELKNKKITKIINTLHETVREEMLIHSKKADKEFGENKVKVIKDFLDSILVLLHLMKPFSLKKDGKIVEGNEIDPSFYSEFDYMMEQLNPIIPLYNKVRNYLTKNRKNLEKIKINFENSQLLEGWDVNKEKDRLAVLLRKKEQNRWKYYLGIMNIKHKKIFDYHAKFGDSKTTISNKTKLRKEIIADHKNKDHYEKMNYKQVANVNKDIQNLIRMKNTGKVERKTKNLDGIKKDNIPDIYKIKSTESYLKNNVNFKKKDLVKFINYYKKCATEYWSWVSFDFRESKEYLDFNDFTNHLSSQGYKLDFDKIKSSYVQEKVEKGELYLFQIYSKDFSNYGKGKSNLHTKYFEFLFDQDNLKDIVFKLDGSAEIFHRKSSLKRKITHPKNEPIKNKNPYNSKKQSVFKYDLIKNKRFTENKFFLHLPIKLNFKTKDIKSSKFNEEVKSFLKNNPKINIIGIDRGEKHLTYYTVINQQGEILEQNTFNTISNIYKSRKQGKEIRIETNYHSLLEGREGKRDDSRKSWSKIENIKELKSGYLSQVVHKISQLVVKHNAIVIFEDLNSGFKRGRMKFEKQVYQKLEKALIDKLNYLVFKDYDVKKPGGYLNAYQFTAPFESFQKMGKQIGFIFYVPAYHTSKVDPLTGFVNLIHPHYKNMEESKKFFSKFEKIYFNTKKEYFVFEYKDGEVNPIRKSESNYLWTVCSYGDDRYVYCRKTKSFDLIDVTKKLKDLFEEFKIDYSREENLIDSICKQESTDFFKSLIFLLRTLLQLRYVNPKAQDIDKKDFILSPVYDMREKRFFDSRTSRKNEPKNADANGAYHIALKGLRMIQDLNKHGSINTKITNKEWFKFIQDRNISAINKAV